MRERGLLAIVALAALLAFAFLFSGVISASETEPGMLYDEQGNLIGMKVDQAQARREMSTDMLQDAGRQIEAVDAGQKTLRTFSSGDEPIPMEPPFAPDVLVYTSATADDTPRMAFNPTDGLLWVTFTHFNGVDDDIIVFYSDDVGATWSFSVQTIGAYNERNPSIAIAGNTIIIFYEQDNLGNEQHTFFIRSKDGGLNWEGPLYMDWAWTNDPAYAQLEDFNNPDVSVVRPQWFHFTADAWGVRDATRTVSFMWTETDGDSWSMVYWTIGWHLGEDFERPVIMENSADDMIHNAYQHWNTTEAGWDIEWLIVDHGLTTISGWWTANLDAGNTEISPDISIRDDYVYLVWQNGTATPDLTAFYSDDGGSASLWILPIRSNDGFDQMYPAVYLDTSYVPHISAVNDTSITYLNNTDIFTQPWSEVKADDFPGWTVADFRATDIIYELNNPRIVFTDARLGAADIWYTDLGVAPTVQYTITRSPLIAQGDIIIDGSILCSGTCVYDWTLGETHTLEAPTLMTDPVDPANVRYSYSAWSDGGAQTHQITVGSSALTLTAIYDPQYNITFETLPDPNLDILIDTVLYTAPQSFWFTAGQLVTMDVPSPQTIDATSRYVWQSWSDGGLQSHLKTISMVETFTATFAVEYLVNVNTNPAGLDVDVDGLIYNLAVNPFWWLDGSTHDLNAISPQTVTPDEQWAFVDWSDGGAQVHPVTVIGPATYTANYTTQYKISFTTSPAGLDVEVDGVLNDTGAAPVNYFWDVGSVHTICAPSPQTINPTSQYEFLSWNDGGAQCHDITVTAPATYTANFGVEYRIDVNTSPMIRLNITVDAIEYTAPYSFWCAQGSPATLGAPSPQPQTPTMRYSWVSWSDGGTQSHPIICTMANAYTATFVPQYLLNFSTDPQGLLIEVDVIQYTAPHTEWYDTGATVSINAPSPQLSGNTQAVYRNWNDGQPQSHLITVTGTATYIAYFDTQYLVTITSTPVTGLSVEVDSFPQTTEYQFWCDDGNLFTVNANSPQNGPVANSRYVWNSWSDGLGQAHTITCNRPDTYTADFTLQYQLTITTNPPGLQVVVDNITRNTPYQPWWDDGSVHNIGVNSPQDQIPGSSQYDWRTWSDAGAQFHDITATGADTYVASFTLQYKITITSDPPGLEILADAAAYTTPYVVWWDEASSHSLDVTDPQIVVAGERYSFNSWSDAQPKSHTIIVAMSTTYTAYMDHEFEVNIDSLPVPGISVTVDSNAYTTPVSFWWLEGSSHLISAVDYQSIGAGVRYAWDSWSDSGTISHNIQADMAKTLTASYRTQYEVTITTSPTGLDVVVDSATLTAPQMFWWDDGSPHTIDVVTPQPGATGERHTFASWSDGGAQSHSVTVTQSETITATFGLEYEVTITSDPTGRDVTVDSTPYVTPQTFWVASGGSLSVQGTSPQPGVTGVRYAFSRWSDGPAIFDRAITVTAATTYTAVFTTQYEVTVATSPAGLEIIVDSATLTAPQTYWWDDGSSHTIDVASPQAGTSADEQHAFASWSDGGAQSHSVTVGDTETITATFDLQYLVTIASTPAGREVTVGGTTYVTPQTFWVTSGGDLVVSGVSPQPILAVDTQYVFSAWSDGPTTFTRTITISSAATYTATFTTQHYLLVVSLFGSPQGSGWYDEGTVVDFSVTTPVTVEGKEMEFTGWSGDSTSSKSSDTIVMDGPKTVAAGWQETGFLQKFWWIFPIIIIIIIIAIVALMMMKRKKPEEELPPPEEMEIPPEEEE